MNDGDLEWKRKRKKNNPRKKVNCLETQSQKLHGNNFQNNNITVDFKTRKVTFVPASDFSLYHLMYTFSKSIFMLSLIFPVCFLMYSSIGFHDNIYIYLGFPTLMLAWFLKVALIMLVGSILITAPMLIPYWMKHYYPKFNAGFAYLIHIFGGWDVFIPRIETARTMKTNVFIIPSFENVHLYYSLTKDFSRQIKKIHVHNHIGQSNNFYAVFEFYKKPVDGRLLVWCI